MERRTNAPAHFSSSETPPCLPPPRPGGATRLETAASAPARRRDVGVAKPETKRPTALWAPASARYVGEGVGRLRGCRLLEVRPLQGHTLLSSTTIPEWRVQSKLLGSSMALVTFKTKAERLHKNPDKMEASLSANISEFDAARNYIRLTEDMKPEKLLATRAKAKTTADRDAPFLL
ncbi:hypothetical protein MUK42_37523, partial [Musa troglodytarum]